MIKYSVSFTPAAKQQLFEIADFLFINYGNETCNKVIDSVKEKVDSLSQFPNRGINPKDNFLQSIEIKYLICGHYYIFYRVYEKKFMVCVYGIFDGRTDYKKYFKIIQ